MWRYIPTDELYHYGIPGMKWGVRKIKQTYNNVKKKIRKRKADRLLIAYNKKYNKLMGTNMPKNSLNTNDVQNNITTKNISKNVSKKKSDTNSEKEKSMGRKFVETVGKEVLKPALIEAGKKSLSAFFTVKFNETLGLSKDTKKELQEKEKELSSKEKELTDLRKELDDEKKDKDKNKNKSKDPYEWHFL